MGVGALGLEIHDGLPGATACLGTDRNPRAAGALAAAMLLGQALAQTPAVFALLVAFLILFRGYSLSPRTLTTAAAILGAAVSTGFAAVGPGLGAGFPAASAFDATARRPGHPPVLLPTMLVGQAVSRFTSICGLVVSLLLLYVV